MKTKAEIINNHPTSFSEEIIMKHVDELTEGLYKMREQGYKSFTKIVREEGSYEKSKNLAKQVAKVLNEMGFYARHTSVETTPNGNEKPAVILMLEDTRSWFDKLMGF